MRTEEEALHQLTAQSTMNGVNVEQLVGTINLVKAQPDLAAFELRAGTDQHGDCLTRLWHPPAYLSKAGE